MTIFNFSETKSFLRDYIENLPKKGRGESSRLAKHLQVSTTLISQILSGEKFLTLEQAQNVCAYLGLTGLDADYFIFLVQFERAGSQELKLFWKRKLDELKMNSMKLSKRVNAQKVLTEQERAQFYSSPLYSAIRLYTSTSNNGKSTTEICERFDRPRGRVTSILKFLTETGLCIEKNDRYLMGVQSTHLAQGSHHLSRHHANWRLKAIQEGETLSNDELMYSAPVSLSKADFENLREEMVQFIKKFLAKVHASPAEDIACFNLDFFWIKKL